MSTRDHPALFPTLRSLLVLVIEGRTNYCA